jgi:hypothetical protein
MNPCTRRAALFAIGAIAVLASFNALAHSYAGLYDWAVHHRLGGRQAMSWPMEIDVCSLAVGELGLYVAYLDAWTARQRLWPCGPRHSICQDATRRGERLSQRALARQLRERGHRFPNEHLHLIATSVGLALGNAA